MLWSGNIFSCRENEVFWRLGKAKKETFAVTFRVSLREIKFIFIPHTKFEIFF